VQYYERPLEVEGALMVMPFTQTAQAQQAAQLMVKRAGAPGMVLAINDSHGDGFTALVNSAFKASKSAFFGYVAQDAFAGRRWLALAIEALGEKKALLGFNDGKWAGGLAGFGLARRSWAQANYGGDFFFPKYQRHYADAELTVLALQAKGYVYEPQSVLVEVDWAKDGAAVHAPDRALYRERAARGFDARVKDTSLATMFA
jgi:hypothetical protein